MSHDELEPNPYTDFSEESDLVQGFDPGSSPEPWVEATTKELQKALSRRNPVTSVRQLTAFAIINQAYQHRNLSKQLRTVSHLLTAVLVLLAVLVFILAK